MEELTQRFAPRDPEVDLIRLFQLWPDLDLGRIQIEQEDTVIMKMRVEAVQTIMGKSGLNALFS